jgi:membrane-associated protease RseP (regulator of RpoE activity)
MSRTSEEAAPSERPLPVSWRANLGLFLVTAASVFITGVLTYPTPGSNAASHDDGFFVGLVHAFRSITPSALINGGAFAGTLLTILVAHELGHYIAARIHRVDASLPFFIPLPILSPFGTMGAIIRMRGTIPTRRALLDIGASGPLAGLAFALPLYAWGVSHSQTVPIEPDHMMELGEPILIKILDSAFAPPVRDGLTIVYSPVAFGAWGGLFVTMINLLPVSQLDGGHVAYALFGAKQDRYATTVHRAMLVFFGVIVAGHVGRGLLAGRILTSAALARHLGNALFWLVWFQAIAAIGTAAARARATDADATTLVPIRTRLVATFGLVLLSSMAQEHPSWWLLAGFGAGLAILIAMDVRGGSLGRGGRGLVDHPPTAPEGLDPLRKTIAIVTLVLFGLLFMPEPFSL